MRVVARNRRQKEKSGKVYLVVFVEIGQGPIGVGHAHALKLRLQIEEAPSGRARNVVQTGRVMEAVQVLDVHWTNEHDAN
jgi:hypothetical protein